MSGDTGGGGDSGGGGGNDNGDNTITDALIDMVTTKTSIMQLSDGIPIDEKRKISHDENDIHDDADGEADDDEERYGNVFLASEYQIIGFSIFF